jgi:hypothetical protein
MGGYKKIYPISLVVDTLDTRFEGLSMNLENISNLRNVFLENKVWKVWDKKVWDRNNFLGFFELGS